MTRIYSFAFISDNTSTYFYYYIFSVLYRYISYNVSLFSVNLK